MNKQDVVYRIKSNFPEEIQLLHQWVVWRIEYRDDKPTKVPYSVSGLRAESDNPDTWTSFDVACSAYVNGNYSGVGFMFSEYDPYTGVDFDKCVSNGEIEPEKLAHIDFLDSYTEFSQSETGAHVIVKATLPPGGRKSIKHNTEMYDNKRFFVVTGNVFGGFPRSINERQTHIEHLHAQIFPAKQSQVQAQTVGHRNTQANAVDMNDEALLKRMFGSVNGAKIRSLYDGNRDGYDGDDSAADLALCNYLAFWTGNDEERINRLFKQSGLYRAKWDRNARTGETYGEGTIARAIAGTPQPYNPQYANGNDSNGRSAVNGLNGSNGSARKPAQQAIEDNTEPQSEDDIEPLDKDEIDALAYRAEDGGIMDAWLEYYGENWLFSVGPDQWRFWFDTYWKLDDELMVGKQILDLMDMMNRQCSSFMREAPSKIKDISNKYATLGIDIPDAGLTQIENIKRRYEVAKGLYMATKRSSSKAGSVEIMSRKQRAIAVSKFDIDESLNLANGVLSLRSLELRSHSREELFTYCMDYEYNPDADCPLFKKFISEVLVKEGTTETDQSLVDLFQELLGYSMTPDVKHEVMVWMYGDGSNGKSVAISVIEALLGPMSLSIDFQTIGTPGNYDLSDVPGKRVLFSTEAEKGKAMAESYIKRIVTGDTLSARPIYGSTIKFKSTAKIWWAMNDKPIIKDTTDAMWRRMKLIPFFRKFVEGKTADPDLTKKLLNELPGILNWALAGLIRLKLNNKFTVSQASEAAKAEYREEANPVAQWMNTMTVKTSYPATLAGALFDNFRRWCEQSNERTITATQFGRDLTRLKVDSQKKMTGKMYNLALIDNRDRERE